MTTTTRIRSTLSVLCLMLAPIAAQSQVEDRVPLTGLNAVEQLKSLQADLMRQAMGGQKPNAWQKAWLKARMSVLSKLMMAEMQAKGLGGTDLSVAFPFSDEKLKKPRDLDDVLLVPVRSVAVASFQRRSYEQALRDALRFIDDAARQGAVDAKGAPVVEFRRLVEAIRATLGDQQQAQAAVLAYRSWLTKDILRPADAAHLPKPVPIEATSNDLRAPAASEATAMEQPQGYLPLPELDAGKWGDSEELRQALADRAQFYWQSGLDPVLSARLHALNKIVLYLDVLDERRAQAQAQVDQTRNSLDEARTFGQEQMVPHLQRMLVDQEEHLAALDRREGFLPQQGTPRRAQATPHGLMDVCFADVANQPPEQLLKHLMIARQSLGMTLKDGIRDPSGMVQAIPERQATELRTLAQELAKIAGLIQQGDQRAAQQQLDQQCARVLSSFDGMIESPLQSPLEDLPEDRDANAVASMTRQAQQLAQEARQLQQERRLVAALRLETRAAWINARVRRIQERTAADAQLQQLRSSYPNGAPNEQFARMLKDNEHTAARLADRRRIALARNLKLKSNLGVFFADVVHGQPIQTVPAKLKGLAINLRSQAPNAATAAERQQCEALANECDRIAALLIAGDHRAAQQAMDAQWALVLGKQAATATGPIANLSETYEVPTAWVDAAKRGRIDPSMAGREIRLNALRELVFAVDSRRGEDGKVPLASVRTLASNSRRSLTVLLADAGDPGLADRCRSMIQSLRDKRITDEERAAREPFCEVLQGVIDAIQRDDRVATQQQLDQGWQRVLTILQSVHVPPDDASLAEPAFAVPDEWLTEDYWLQLRQQQQQNQQQKMQKLQQHQPLQQSFTEQHLLSEKLALIAVLRQHSQAVGWQSDALDQSRNEQARLQRLGRPVPKNLTANIEQYETFLTGPGSVPAPRALFVDGLGGRNNNSGPLANGELFLRSSKDPVVSTRLRKSIRAIEDMLDPPRGRSQGAGSAILSEQQRRELQQGLARYRRLLKSIEADEFDAAQAELDRMAEEIRSFPS